MCSRLLATVSDGSTRRSCRSRDRASRARDTNAVEDHNLVLREASAVVDQSRLLAARTSVGARSGGPRPGRSPTSRRPTRSPRRRGTARQSDARSSARPGTGRGAGPRARVSPTVRRRCTHLCVSGAIHGRGPAWRSPCRSSPRRVRAVVATRRRRARPAPSRHGKGSPGPRSRNRPVVRLWKAVPGDYFGVVAAPSASVATATNVSDTRSTGYHVHRSASVGLEGGGTAGGLGDLGGLEVRTRRGCRAAATTPGRRRGGCGSGRSTRRSATGPRGRWPRWRCGSSWSSRRCRARCRSRRAGGPSACRRTGTSQTIRGVAKPGQVAHDRVLQLLGVGDRDPPVLRERDHVAHVEVVRHDLRAIEQREAEVEQGVRVGVDAVEDARPGCVRRGCRCRASSGRPSATSGVTELAWLTWVWIAMDTPRDRAIARHALHALRRRRPAASAGGDPSAPWWRAGCRGCSRSRAGRSANASRRGHGMLATSPPETTTSRTCGVRRR